MFCVESASIQLKNLYAFYIYFFPAEKLSQCFWWHYDNFFIAFVLKIPFAYIEKIIT